jgi:hypothetical protein
MGDSRIALSSCAQQQQQEVLLAGIDNQPTAAQQQQCLSPSRHGIWSQPLLLLRSCQLAVYVGCFEAKAAWDNLLSGMEPSRVMRSRTSFCSGFWQQLGHLDLGLAPSMVHPWLVCATAAAAAACLLVLYCL